MPNHVNCVLRVTGDAEAVRAFKERCVGAGPRYTERPDSFNYSEAESEPCVLDFNRIVPVPSDVLARGYSNAGHGWQSKHWGTKWNAYGPPVRVDLPNGVAYFFETAWSTPKGWLAAAAALFPMLHFELWARDEYPWAETIEILPSDTDGERCVERCYGEERDSESVRTALESRVAALEAKQ